VGESVDGTVMWCGAFDELEGCAFCVGVDGPVVEGLFAVLEFAIGDDDVVEDALYSGDWSEDGEEGA
jgi:hypothetical protein